MNWFSDNKEWQWLFRNGVDWDSILKLYYPKYPTVDGLNDKEEVLNFIGEMLGMTADWCGNSLSEKAEALDTKGAGEVRDGKTWPSETLQAVYNEAAELGAYGLTLPREFGGMEVPYAAGMMMLCQLCRAELGAATQIAFYGSIGDMIDRFGDEEDKKRLIPMIVKGEISGSMCLTEPGCGSDLSKIKTTATPTADGKYLLNGQKIFITNGGGGIGFVLAKLPDAPEGLDGISMFIVEQEIPGKEGLNFTIAKNEEKMGLHGSFTCVVNYDNSVAKLIGEPHQGFKYMLHLMNEARIAVGMQGLGLIEGALAYARQYADERQAFGKPISELPLLKRNLEDFETERDALRALVVDTASHFDIFQRLDMKKRHTNDLTTEEEAMFKDAMLWTRKRTPLVKYYATEAATSLTTKAIQVLGGYGFIKEYPVEKFHRDSFAPLLYEGTSQIQALMALKDVIKYAIKDPKSFFSNIFYKHPSLEFLSGANEWSYEFRSVHYRFKKKMLGLLFSTLKPEGAGALSPSEWVNIDEDKVGNLMIHAETLCQALSYMETLRVLCEHANKDKERADLFFRYQRLVRPRLEAIYADWNERA